MISKAQEAADMFNDGFICSQVVLAALSDKMGLEKELALKIANGFGGGIARKQLICGAVSGAIMLIGLKYGKTDAQDSISHERTYSVIDKFCDEFEKRNKSIMCKDILGCDMTTAREQGLFSTICSKCVKDAINIVENLL